MVLRSFASLRPDERPAILVSYVYLNGFLRHRANIAYRDWVLDSGAFSAKHAGRTVKVADFIATAKSTLALVPPPAEIYALDVIGDHLATKANCDVIKSAGVDAIPTYHLGEPWSALKELAAAYPKIAVGGIARLRGKEKLRWIEQVFARVWPKRVHGFGCGTEEIIMRFPFDSVDATTWVNPSKYGAWKAYKPGGRSYGYLSVPTGKMSLTPDIRWFLELEQRVQARWRASLEPLRKSNEPVAA